jgi:hypothetical protein
MDINSVDDSPASMLAVRKEGLEKKEKKKERNTTMRDGRRKKWERWWDC